MTIVAVNFFFFFFFLFVFVSFYHENVLCTHKNHLDSLHLNDSYGNSQYAIIL